MPWIYNEDAALKLKLQGLSVADANSSYRRVPVRFRLPETELANLQYPILIIEHAGFFPAPEREHRGFIQLPYSPEGQPIWWDPAATSYDPSKSPYWTYFPIPYNFDYQVTLYSRSWVEHQLPLMAALATENYLPYHFGYLNIPQDGTVRPMYLMGGPAVGYTKDNDGKRRYQTTYRVRVFSELLWPMQTVVPLTDLHLDLSVYESIETLSVNDLTESFDLKSVGAQIGWSVLGS